MTSSPARKAFDADYYEYYYGNKRTRAVAPEDTVRQANFVLAYMAYIKLPVKQVLDVGCGLGLWQAPLLAQHPKAKYRGVEYSEFLCQKFGWIQSRAETYRDGRLYDLIICQSVLQYLTDRQALQAIRNFAGMCRGALYLEAPTKKDWAQNVDRTSTDGNVNLRTAAWYRRALKPYFIDAGGGLFVAHESPAVFYELEARS